MKGATLSATALLTIEQSGHSWSRKELSIELNRQGIKCTPQSLGVILKRLHDRGLLDKEGRGKYRSPLMSQYERVANLIQLDHKETPKLHNIRISFLPRKLKTYYNSLDEDQKKVFCEQFAPVIEGGQEPLCNKTIVGVSTPSMADIIHRLTSVTDPDSLIYSLLTSSRSIKKSKGLHQEVYDFKGHEIKLQYYGTGTIEIFVNATHNPIEAPDMHQFIDWLDALFLGRTGFSFKEISPLFHITRIEFNRDGKVVSSDMPYGRHSTTVKMLDDWMMKVYEKNAPDEDGAFIREEIIYTPGEISPDTQTTNFLASLEAAMAGGVNTQFLIAQVQELSKMNRTLFEAVRQNSNMLSLMHHQMQHGQPAPPPQEPKKIIEEKKDPSEDVPDFITADMLFDMEE